MINEVLPPEMLTQIFDHLNGQDLFNATLVCKLWNKIFEKHPLKPRHQLLSRLFKVEQKSSVKPLHEYLKLPKKEWAKQFSDDFGQLLKPKNPYWQVIYRNVEQMDYDKKISYCVEEFAEEFPSFKSTEFFARVNVLKPYWKAFLKGQLLKLDKEKEIFTCMKTFHFVIRDMIEVDMWKEVDEIFEQHPLSVNRLCLSLYASHAAPHASPSYLPLKLFEMSPVITEMSLKLSKRMVFSKANYRQLSQLILKKAETPECSNVETLVLSFIHIDIEAFKTFIMSLSQLPHKLTIYLNQGAYIGEICRQVYVFEDELNQLANKVNPKIEIFSFSREQILPIEILIPQIGGNKQIID